MSLELETRLRAAGLSPDTPVVPHTNRRVLVTLTRRGALRVHAGYRFAPDPVLAAIARWAHPRLRRGERLAAGRILAAFPVHDHIPPAAPRRRPLAPVDSADAGRLERLEGLHRLLNARHFGGALGKVEIRLSPRMRRRLGEFRPGSGSEPVPVITLSRRHLRRDGWSRATETLLHEMVHQWQAENDRPLSHGPEFRLKCSELGIEGRAVARSGSIFCP